MPTLNSLTKYGEVGARILVASLFLVSGVDKLSSVPGTQAYMMAFGVPAFLVWPAAAWEIGAGALLVLGLWTRPLAVLLAGWCVLTAVIFHRAFSDPVMLMMFFKNITMTGSFLLMARFSHAVPSLDRVTSRAQAQA